MSEPFSTSQRVDPDRDFPDLAAAITAVPAARPGGSALAAAAELRALVALQRRLAAAVLDRLACFDSQGFAVASGSASTAAWLRAYTNATAPAAASLVAAARTTRTLPLLAGELTGGRIGVEHLQAVARATRDVPAEVLAEHDTTLRDAAPHLTPAHLHRAGVRIAEGWDAAAVAQDLHHVEDSRRLSLSQTLHGVWALDGKLTPEAGAKLAAALQPLMAKRGPEDDRTAPQRRADALLELVDIALTSAALPDCGGDRTRITLVVHATEAALDQLQHAHDQHQTGHHQPTDDEHPGYDETDHAQHTDDEHPGYDETEHAQHTENDHHGDQHTEKDLRGDQHTEHERTETDEGGADRHEDTRRGSEAGPGAVPEPGSRAGRPPDRPAPGLLLPGLLVPAQRAAGRQPDSAPLLAGPPGASPGDRAALPPGSAGVDPRRVRSGPGAWLTGGRLAAVFGDPSSHRQLLGSHAAITLNALTRLGCDAELAVAVLDATGQPLYLSRSSRDPNTTQRRLLVIRDGGCVFPGCDRPPSYCQAHHLTYWSHGGRTDIDNLALLCGFHHWLIHDKHWTLQALPASLDAPTGGWQARSPDGLTLTRHRQPTA